MYAAGRPHPHRSRAVVFFEQIARGEIEAAIDSKVLQEILHRLRALNRWAEGKAIYDDARLLFSDCLPITASVMDQARTLLDLYATLTARGAVHAAVVQLYSLDSICSFDRDFDLIRGLRRIEP